MQLADVHSALIEPSEDARPMVRWWWFGPDARGADTDRQLESMARAGIGGVEVAYVYPLRVGSTRFLSPEFLAELRHAAERARELGLRFDLTLTSGWPFGGPHIDAEHASHGIVWERRSVTPGAHRISTAAQWPGDRLIAAAIAAGDVHEPLRDLEQLDIEWANASTDNDADIDTNTGELVIPAGSGPRQVVLGFIRPTGQVVKRAAAGAEGPALDHYSADATRLHLDTVGRALIDAVPAELIGSFFCDSLEVYGANWTPGLPAEFARRRGYDLMPQLHLLVSTDESARVFRADFHRTLTELFEENFVQVCSQWCHERGVPFRIQGYGVPPARPSSYRSADQYEGEGWGWKTLTATRWASSAAHIDGADADEVGSGSDGVVSKRVVSAEAWTWVHSPSFRATPLDIKGEAHEHFLAGINQLVGHGWPYSPADADGLGWFFYASGALDDRNAWWPAMPSLMRYLQRLSAVLQLGSPTRDVLVYLPLADIYAGLGDDLDLFKATARHLPPALFATIREHGRDFDVFDDAMIDRIPPSAAGVVIVASATDIGTQMTQWLQAVTDAGGAIVVLADSDAGAGNAADSGPGGAAFTGGRTCTIADLPAMLDHVCPPVSRLAEPNEAVGIVRRHGTTTDVHVIVNTGPHQERVTWSPSGERARLEVWDADTGAVLAARSTGRTEEISLAPYAAVVIIETDEAPAPGKAIGPGRETEPEQEPPAGASRVLRPIGECTVAFPGEDPIPVNLPHRWDEDSARAGFSGTARYTLAFDVPADWEGTAAAITLRFGDTVAWTADRVAAVDPPHSFRALLDTPIGEVAEVLVNSESAGVVWAAPYALDVRTHIRPGRNTIEIAVSNTTAPALALDTAHSARAAEVRGEYGERFRYQDIEHALDDVRSGLLCLPTLESRLAP